MTKVVKSLCRNLGVRRSKEQLRKRWSDLKLREQDQYRRIKKVLLKRLTTFGRDNLYKQKFRTLLSRCL
ncbi:hypothetical protein AB205_0033660 [Aquarana catesbeiana]|uniref:Uncharacterized protein n=1 Tax=Aquarana catesbeiana TaxID=8400 RepID=A0A2G9NAW6_AQUCT|nr:hypothetical protein AB205_0033660 [Aquarana catesbeiana]